MSSNFFIDSAFEMACEFTDPHVWDLANVLYSLHNEEVKGRGLVFMNTKWEGRFLGRGDPIRVRDAIQWYTRGGE